MSRPCQINDCKSLRSELWPHVKVSKKSIREEEGGNDKEKGKGYKKL